MLIALWPLVVAVIGIVMYAITNGKVSEAGRITFFVGLFWLVATLAKSTLTISG